MLRLIFLSIILVSCASKTKYSGTHGGQLYSQGKLAVEVVENKDHTLDLYVYQGNKIIPANGVSLQEGFIDEISSHHHKVVFKKSSDHFQTAAPVVTAEYSQTLLHFQMVLEGEMQEFSIPL